MLEKAESERYCIFLMHVFALNVFACVCVRLRVSVHVSLCVCVYINNIQWPQKYFLHIRKKRKYTAFWEECSPSKVWNLVLCCELLNILFYTMNQLSTKYEWWNVLDILVGISSIVYQVWQLVILFSLREWVKKNDFT